MRRHIVGVVTDAPAALRRGRSRRARRPAAHGPHQQRPPRVGGFPAWFQDKTGLTMEFCDLLSQAELNGGWCTLIPPTPSAAPESFPNNFFIEHFYHDARGDGCERHDQGPS